VGAFDTAFKPRAVTPSNTSEQDLFIVGTHSSSQDVQVNINVSVIGTTTPTARIGFIPLAGAVFWIIFDDPIETDNPIIGLGPFFLQNGDIIRVRSSVANDLTFSVTGTESS